MVQSLYKPDGSVWDDEDIVISGISARLPNCDSVEEFQKKILAKVDLITDEPRRFQNGLYGAIKRYGLLKDLSKFDAKFFNIHPKQADRMDPQIRNLLEVTYEATLDAGLHPNDLKGTKTGVVVGVASSETQDKWSQMPDRINGYEYSGCTRTMFANRVSYFFDIKGPSYSIDTASSTTLVAFQQAYDMIRDGVCDACFVCGTDLVLNPCVCLMFQCLNMLSPEGKCKAFDISGDGYVRSEGVVAVLLQKAKNAKRVYANVLAAGSNCDGYKNEGITFPSGDMQVKLFRRVAEIARIEPTTIDFMEAHGSATRVGDPQEMNAVTEVFTKGRKGPLPTGSIKSNMGHGEPASALSAVIKICVAMEHGVLPPNLHYNIPNPDIPALLDGRLKVITEPTPWDGGLVAVNSFGVGGANGHALLLSNKKQKQIIEDSIPRLVCVSGVTESAVYTMLNKIQSLPKDSDLYGLLNNIHRKNISGHAYRGFIVMDSNIKAVQKIKVARPDSLCIFLPGLESNWKSLDADMLNVQIFQDTIEACEKELKKKIKNFNLNSILISISTEKSLLNLVVGVTALQIGLICVLRTLEIVPIHIIGCNIGEIAAGYADDVYTIQQAICIAYNVGSVLQQFYYPSTTIKSNVPRRESNPPADISVSVELAENITLFSGPKQSATEFIKKLKKNNYEATESEYFAVDVLGILRNSGCVLKLKCEFEKILTNTNQPKKWSSLSASSSAEHLIDALTRSASKTQTLLSDIENLVVLELGPRIGFPEMIPTVSLIPEKFNVINFLSSVGQLFNNGLHPQIQNIYPKIEFPVPHSTPMIQSMIEWDHSENWNVVSFAPEDGRIGGELDIVVDFDKDEFKSLRGNEISGTQVLAKGFYIYLLWKAMGRLQNRAMTDFPLVIENIFFSRETPIPEDGSVKFNVNVLGASGRFEIIESDFIVVSGEVRIPLLENLSKEQIPHYLVDHEPCFMNMDVGNVYRSLSINQYRYNNAFKSISSFSYKSTIIHYNEKWNVLKSDNIEMHGVILESKPLTELQRPHILCSKFVPFIYKNIPIENAAEISIGLALENFAGYNNLKIAELMCNTADSSLSEFIKTINPLLSVDLVIYCKNLVCFDSNISQKNKTFIKKDVTTEPLDTKYHLIIARNILNNPAAFKNLQKSIRIHGCIVLEEKQEEEFNNLENVRIISRISSCSKTFFILKKVHSKLQTSPRVLTVTDILDCAQKLKHIPSDGHALIVAKSSDVSGIVPFMKSTLAETETKNLSIMLIEDKNAPLFSLKDPIYAKQLQNNFPINVYKDGAWGTYVSLSFSCTSLIPIEHAYMGLTYELGETTTAFAKANSTIYNHKVNSLSVCQIHCASINMRDVKLYQGEFPIEFPFPFSKSREYHLGLEFAGYEGERRVCGLVPGGALATSVICEKDFLWDVPRDWSFEEAATIPLAFALSYYGLKIRGNLQTGVSILIIGVNSVAIAAVYIALRQNCNVLLLLKDKQQMPLLRKLFPQIRDTNLIVADGDNFYLEILANTAGKGVQLLFNTLPVKSYKFQSYVSSLTENGVCVYFSYDQPMEESLGSTGNMRCLTFHRITPLCLFDKTNVGLALRKEINQYINNGMMEGVVKPLPYLTFLDINIAEGFSCISKEDNIYKAVVKIQHTTDNNIVTQRRVYFDGSKSYIILVDDGEFNAYIITHMVSQGAQHLIFINNSSESNKLSEKIIHSNSNCEALKMKDFSIKSCESLLQDANQIAPVGGVFDFTQFELDGTDIMEFSAQQKVAFLSNMDTTTRKLCPLLDYFVAFSFVQLNLGVPGYSTLANANGIIQNIMRNRKDSGLSGILLQWGKVGESLDEIFYNNMKTEICLSPQSVVSCLQSMHLVLKSSEPVLSSFVIHENKKATRESKADAVVEGVAKFLGIKDPNSILPTLTMLELGLDSLIGTDIQQFLEINYGVSMNTQEVRELTFEKLRKMAENL